VRAVVTGLEGWWYRSAHRARAVFIACAMNAPALERDIARTRTRVYAGWARPTPARARSRVEPGAGPPAA